jgi:transcriptional/translational regulatory protein YebC/TACO1
MTKRRLAQNTQITDNTNRGIGKIIVHYGHRAGRILSNGCVSKAEMFKQKCVVAEQVGSPFRIRERRDRVSL